jgi:hypothetical protein
VIFGIVSNWAVANFRPLGFLNFSSWYGYLIFVLAGIIYQKGWKKTFGILSIVLEIAFAFISMQVRNIPIEIMSNYLIIMIFIFDLYLMLALYYLYSNLINLKKEIK